MENLLQLAMQMILCLVIAALIGAIIGYLLGRIGKCPEHAETRDDNRQSVEAPQQTLHAQKHAPKSGSDTLATPPSQPKQEQAPAQTVTEETPQAMQKKFDNIEGERPPMLSAPRNGIPDDLKEISGIGLKIEEKLHELGIFHFDQIANWTPDNIRWVEQYLDFKGRISRENWVGQAKILARGSADRS